MLVLVGAIQEQHTKGFSFFGLFFPPFSFFVLSGKRSRENTDTCTGLLTEACGDLQPFSVLLCAALSLGRLAVSWHRLAWRMKPQMDPGAIQQTQYQPQSQGTGTKDKGLAEEKVENRKGFFFCPQLTLTSHHPTPSIP